MKNVFILIFLLFIKVGDSQKSKDFDSSILKFINEFKSNTEYQVQEHFDAPVDSCISIAGDRVVYFYKPILYYSEGYRSDDSFISQIFWPDNTSETTILFYNKIGFDYVRMSCFFKNGKAKYVSIVKVPLNSMYEFHYYISRLGLFNRMKIRAERYTVIDYGHTKQCQDKITLSEMADQLTKLRGD